jgi:hypothetical protein
MAGQALGQEAIAIGLADVDSVFLRGGDSVVA